MSIDAHFLWLEGINWYKCKWKNCGIYRYVITVLYCCSNHMRFSFVNTFSRYKKYILSSVCIKCIRHYIVMFHLQNYCNLLLKIHSKSCQPELIFGWYKGYFTWSSHWMPVFSIAVYKGLVHDKEMFDIIQIHRCLKRFWYTEHWTEYKTKIIWDLHNNVHV